MNKVLVIGSHLDDAVLAAGSFIDGRRGNCDVVTVFAGYPQEVGLLTDYDKKCGFNNSHDAVRIRRQEDEQALAILNATPIWLDRRDSQYNPDYDGLSEELYSLVNDDYEMVVLPLGLRHPDHNVIAEAFLTREYDVPIYLAEDIPARVQHPELVWERLQEFPNAKLEFIGDGSIANKIRALWCYSSQINTGDLDPFLLYVPERFWRVN